MEQPLHTIHAQQTSWLSPNRLAALAAATGLVFAFAWALSIGLAQTLVEKAMTEIKAEVLPDKMPDKTPPPPPPDLKEPPPPYVPPPDFVIQTDAPATTAIASQSKVATPKAISSPASIGPKHKCGEEWYPPISKRLGEQGTTVVAFHIGVDGIPKDITIAGSSGSERLDNAAISCVAANWHYSPAIEEGHPVEVPWKAQVVWNLKGN
ncbi:MAG: energy transducer TonB [Rhizomicrobium sp.]